MHVHNVSTLLGGGGYIREQLMAALLWNIPRGIEMVSVCTGLIGEEGHVSASVDTRL